MAREKLNFSIPAIRIKQREEKDQAIYVGKIKARDLGIRPSERFKIDYYKRDAQLGKRGYQRQLNPRSVDNVKNFLTRETAHPLLPTAILASSRTQLEFKEIVPGTGIGMLKIQDILYIVDGQHRFEAWRQMMASPTLNEQFGDYEIPIVILSNFKTHQEIEQFFVIGSRQKRISTNLAQENLLELSKHADTQGIVPDSKRWELLASVLISALEERPFGVWNGRIEYPDDNSDARKARIISKNSFVSSLKPFFVGKNAVFTTEDERPSVEDWAGKIELFWEMVEEVYKETFHRPNDYALLKTVGVFSLHLFLSMVLTENGGDWEKTLEDAKVKLVRAKETYYRPSFWRSRGVSKSIKERGQYAGAYSSAAGHKRLAVGLFTGQFL